MGSNGSPLYPAFKNTKSILIYVNYMRTLHMYLYLQKTLFNEDIK